MKIFALRVKLMSCLSLKKTNKYYMFTVFASIPHEKFWLSTWDASGCHHESLPLRTKIHINTLINGHRWCPDQHLISMQSQGQINCVFFYHSPNTSKGFTCPSTTPTAAPGSIFQCPFPAITSASLAYSHPQRYWVERQSCLIWFNF